MRISDFGYALPPELIAQHPPPQRDQARLLVADRKTETWKHSRVRDLPESVAPHDLLVLNETRVLPARLYGREEAGGRLFEVLLLKCLGEDTWEALVKPAKKARPGTRLLFNAGGFEAEVLQTGPSRTRRLRFRQPGDFEAWLKKLGKMPLPPYIRRPPDGSDEEDRERYQTVFARVSGSIAAPTAGLHFAPQLLERVRHCKLTLHVGYGTFKPVTVETVEEHRMEAEYYEIPREAAQSIQAQLEAGRRVIAVGTTTARVVESVFRKHGAVVEDRGWTDLFIYPGFQFRVVGGLMTNFHLPKSTLLLLVCAFAGKDFVERCYQEAIRRKYRFYSYGDAMLIL